MQSIVEKGRGVITFVSDEEWKTTILISSEKGHGQPAAGAHGEPAHGEARGHGATLSEVMMHHVANGYVMEFPWVCHGELRANCEVDLARIFGRKADGTGPLVFTVGDVTFDMTPSKHVVMMWIAAALLVLVLLAAGRRRALVPRGLYNFVELLVQFVRDIAVSNIGKRDADRFVPYLATAFFFILFMNLLGLVPWMATATANVSVTVGLALFTFVITQYAAIRPQGIGGYLKHLTGGVPQSLAWLWPIMIPVEILGLFTKPFALTVRLFANMVAGHSSSWRCWGSSSPSRSRWRRCRWRWPWPSSCWSCSWPSCRPTSSPCSRPCSSAPASPTTTHSTCKRLARLGLRTWPSET